MIREETGRRVGRVCGGIDDVTMEGRARWTSMSHQRGYRVVGEGQGGEEEEERKAVITYYVIRRPLGDTTKPAHCFMWCRVYAVHCTGVRVMHDCGVRVWRDIGVKWSGGPRRLGSRLRVV